MKKTLVIIASSLVLIGVLSYAYVNFLAEKTSAPQYVFVCQSGQRIGATFHHGKERSDSSVDLVFDDILRMTLPQTISADGGRYANSDESFIFWNKGYTAMVTTSKNGKETNDFCAVEEAISDYKTIAYGVDGKDIFLGNNGTQYFGNEVRGDFDGDGTNDVAFIFIHQPGGSGTFYYAAVARGVGRGYFGTEAVFLGDRIAPQTTEFRDGKIIVNYADRKLTDSFAVAPSIGKSKWLILDKKTHELGEVAQNFEGEADPSRMTLPMQVWRWVKTSYNNDTTVAPNKAGAFTATFTKEGKVSFATDCNRISGTYSVTGSKIALGPLMSTKMYCEGSQEDAFAKMLGEVSSFLFTSKGELILELKLDSGQMVFK